MKSLFRTFVMLTCLLAAVVPLAAQEETQLLALNEAGTYTVEAPARAEIFPVSEFEDLFGDLNGLEGIVITLDEAVILVVTPEEVATLIELPDGEAVDSAEYVDAIFAVLNGIYDSVVPEEETTVINRTVGGFLSPTIRYMGTARDTLYEAENALMIPDPSLNEAFFLDMAAPVGKLLPLRAEIDAMFATLARVEAPVGAAAGGAASGGSCTVETATERTATVRVGPGEHRTALTFLKTGQAYTVEGRFEAEDGGIWYRLVKDEVDPGSSAAELWTAAEGLTETGSCATVGEAAAPPLRPIVGARPTTVPGDTNNGGGGEDPGTTVTGGVTPSSGSWLFTYNSVVTASCAGGGYGEFPFSELGAEPSETLDLVAEPDGSALTIEGYYYPRINETLFLGDDSLGDYNVQAYLFPESTTRMYVEIRLNLVIDGWSCSATVSGNGTRR
jgi:hypothetical protein